MSLEVTVSWDRISREREQVILTCNIIPKGALQWRHKERDIVSNHQRHDCLLNRLFRRRWKKTSKLRVTGLCAENSPVAGEVPAQRPVARKMFPFDDVIKEPSSPISPIAALRLIWGTSEKQYHLLISIWLPFNISLNMFHTYQLSISEIWTLENLNDFTFNLPRRTNALIINLLQFIEVVSLL